MPKSFKAKINAINKWFQQVGDIFGVDSTEMSYLKSSYEQSFKRVPMKVNGKVHLENPDFRNITATDNNNIPVIDRDSISYATSGKNKVYRQVYEEILDRTLEKFERKGGIYKMARSYSYITPSGIIKKVNSLALAKKYKSQIREVAYKRYQMENEHDTNIYVEIEKVDDMAVMQDLKRRLTENAKKPRHLVSTKAEFIELEQEVYEYLANQISRMKEIDAEISAERDEEIPTSAEDLLGAVEIRKR